MDIIYDYDRNNANQVRSAGALEYTLFETVAKKFMQTQYDDELKQSVKEGMIYPHDSAQELYKGINCFTLDPRFILRKGVYSNGDTGHLGCVTKPAKHFNVAIEHLAQTLGLASTCIAGGVAIASINCFLAPYITDLSDKEIYQAIQAFAFQINEAFKNRGSQSLFSSINMDLEMPNFIKEQPAIGAGGKYTGKKYEDYQEEAKKLAHIITQVFLEGDGAGKPLFFPNLIYNIDGVDLSEWEDVFDLTAKFSSPYFAVPSNNNGVEYASTLGCRTSLPSNWTGDPNIDCMGTGNAVYTTICLPAIALKSQEDNVEFLELLKEQMDIVRRYNLKRYDRIKWLWYEQHLADFMIQELDGKPLYRLEDATLVVGYLGLSEALEILYGTPLHKNNEAAREIMTFMKDVVAEYKKEDELRWGLFQTPAENCCRTLAQKMVSKYGFRKSKAKGTSANPYYTNSNHCSVDADINILERIRIEGDNQPLGAAGNIMNIYTSEAYSDPTALRKLVTRIRDLTSAYFFAITGEYSICPVCGTTYRGNKEACIFDEAQCDVISRITGYLGNIKVWNASKQEEFKDRKRY